MENCTSVVDSGVGALSKRVSVATSVAAASVGAAASVAYAASVAAASQQLLPLLQC